MKGREKRNRWKKLKRGKGDWGNRSRREVKGKRGVDGGKKNGMRWIRKIFVKKKGAYQEEENGEEANIEKTD